MRFNISPFITSCDYNRVKNRRKVFNTFTWCDELFDDDLQKWIAVCWTSSWTDLTAQEQGDVNIYPLKMRDTNDEETSVTD